MTILGALIAVACGEPVVPQASSMSTTLVEATPLPLEPTATPEPTPTPEPTLENVGPTPTPVPAPGLSETRVRIGVIVDDNTFGTADGLFADAWLGASAWQLSVNARGGVLGREVELVRFDAALFNHEDQLRAACEGDIFALVGSQSLGDGDGAELLGTQECDLADFPGAVYGARRAVSPVTFVPNPFLNHTRQAGPARYLVEQFPEASQNVALLYYEPLDLADESERLREMLQAAGMQVTYSPVVAKLTDRLSARVVPNWAEAEAQSLVWHGDPGRLIELLDLLELVGQTPAFVLCEPGCYSEAFIEDGGETVEGVYAWVPHIPFGEPGAPNGVTDYLEWLDQVEPGAGWSETGLQSWLAGLLFEEAAELLAAIDEQPARSDLVITARQTGDFTGGEAITVTNPTEGLPTPCFALVVVRDGEWVQEFPAPPLQRNCDVEIDDKPGNLYSLVATRQLGLLPPQTSSTNSEANPDESPTATPEDGEPEDEDDN